MRRDPLEIIEEIFDLLDKECRKMEGECALSINSIAKKTGIHNVTLRRYIRIIETVRKEPDIEIIKTKHAIIMRMKR
jgi:DNA invertase Pin-like site-specific DNA recombinase